MLKSLFRRQQGLDIPAIAAQASEQLRLGRTEEAERLYQSVLTAQPEHFDALHGLGMIRMKQGQFEEAAALIAHAVRIKPESSESLVNLGQALHALGRYEQALASHERALTIHPDSVAALCGRGDALLALQRHDDAIQCYSMVLALEPEHVGVLVNRANLLHMKGRFAEAIGDYDSALLFGPDNAVVSYNRGVALHSIGRHDDAAASFDRALSSNPHYPDALQNLAVVLGELNRHEDELKCYEKLVAIDPDYPHALGNVAYVRAQLAEWKERAELVQAVENAVARGQHAAVPFVFLTLSQDAAAQLSCAAAHAADRHPARRVQGWNGAKYAHDRIRVAYVSSDFHEHAMAYLMAGLFDQHDRNRFEVTAISLGSDASDAMRARLMASFERFIDVRGASDVEIAKIIRDLEIDIAVDLMGFTGGARPDIFAYRPAPVQVNYLGFPGTMGCDYIDYILADRFVIPEGSQQYYSEKTVYLPDTFQANDAKRPIAERTPSRVEVGLPERGFVFCSFNNTYKITPAMFDIWMRLLRDVEGSVLWLYSGNDSVVANLRAEAQLRGVAPARLVFAPKLPYAEHLARCRLADLFLDTLPFNAGTTASDALWAGLPLLTCAGQAFAARMAGSLLTAVGLTEMITDSVEEYANRAMALATHPDELLAVRERLARNRRTAPLFNTDRFRRHLEAAYTTMWEISQSREAPRSFAIEALPA